VLTNYIVGDKPTLKATFKNSSDAVGDPTAVVFVIKEPDGTRTTYTYGTDAEITNPSVGVYQVAWEITQRGHHQFTFDGSGSLEAVGDGEFEARAKISDA
jgi:hypothetical protein